MKYTPLDIQRREFEKAFRGLNEGEVRTFLHEIASEWEDVLGENQRLREEILDLRDRLRQYQEQERIFRETLLQAVRTKEDMLEEAHREKDLILREARFQAGEIVRESQNQVIALELHIRTLKAERWKLLRSIDQAVEQTRKFLEDEQLDAHPSDPTLHLD